MVRISGHMELPGVTVEVPPSKILKDSIDKGVSEIGSHR